jgi:hypothetical protein
MGWIYNLIFTNVTIICSIVLSGYDMRCDVCFARLKWGGVPEFLPLIIYFKNALSLNINVNAVYISLNNNNLM